MPTVQIQLTESDYWEIAHRVAQLQQQQPPAPLPSNYNPTRQLNRNDAAEHLGKHPSTVDNWVKKGYLKRHNTPTGQPYFLLGELDGAAMPALEKRKGVRGYEKRREG